MAMAIKTFEIDGLIELNPIVFGDSRGYFFESYNKRDFEEAGIFCDFVQDNESKSTNGVLRGLHFQKKFPQIKLVRAIYGKIFDIAVDLRNDSPTFGKWQGVILDSEKHNMLYIPAGFAHGFLALTDNCIQSYKCTNFYHPEDEGGIMWNDPLIGIDWESVLPGITQTATLSEKDKNHSSFSFDKQYFDINGNWIGD